MHTKRDESEKGVTLLLHVLRDRVDSLVASHRVLKDQKSLLLNFVSSFSTSPPSFYRLIDDPIVSCFSVISYQIGLYIKVLLMSVSSYTEMDFLLSKSTHSHIYSWLNCIFGPPGFIIVRF